MKFWLVTSCTDEYKITMTNDFYVNDGWDTFRNATYSIPSIMTSLFELLFWIRERGTVTSYKIQRSVPKKVSKQIDGNGRSYTMPGFFIFIEYIDKKGVNRKSGFHITRVKKMDVVLRADRFKEFSK